MALEIALVLFLIVLNGILAMSEIAILSARRARLQQRAERGDAGARLALEMAAAPNRLLSTVQIGITLVGILAGAFGGATIARRLTVFLEGFPWLAEHSEAVALGIVVVATTYLSLVIGELVPKRLALGNAEKIASSAARPMHLLSRLAAPMVRLLGLSTDLVLRLLHVRPSSEPLVTEEDVRTMLREGTQVGVFESAELEMVENVFRLGDRRVSALMTPRPDVVWIDLDDPADVQREIVRDRAHSRFPVARGSLDEVEGIVRAKDLLAQSLAGERLDIEAILRKPLFVPESMRAFKMLESFKRTGVHIAIVLDEYGVTQGMVTHNDVLEAIVGDIAANDRPQDQPAVRRGDGSWLLDGGLAIDELRRILNLRTFPDDAMTYQTLGGLVMARLGAIPATSDQFEWSGLRFEVVDMDDQRVDKVLVTPVTGTGASRGG